ncbi:hypothetical protein RZS08_29775, partial [Arthrospira platensis SPKY1]|nr:hypothetical protein [Arthrospira platensis SPKY1]
LTITRENPNIPFPGQIHVLALSARDMAGYFLGNIEVQITGEESSTLKLSLKDVSPYRARDVLAALMDEYNKASVEEKNLTFKNTIDLINQRVEMIELELSEAERDVESYKQRYQTVELSAEGSMLMNELSVYNKELATADFQLIILDSIEMFL